jgi:hypothetical protein
MTAPRRTRALRGVSEPRAGLHRACAPAACRWPEAARSGIHAWHGVSTATTMMRGARHGMKTMSAGGGWPLARVPRVRHNTPQPSRARPHQCTATPTHSHRARCTWRMASPLV